MATRIRIEPPNQLPSSGVTRIKYRQWQIALKIFMAQFTDYREFFPGGKYTSWICYEDNPLRITSLAVGDIPTEPVEAEEKLATETN